VNESPNGYVPVEVAARFRRQAGVVWAVGLLVVTIWALLIVAAPMARTMGMSGFAGGLYSFFGALCHQLDDRSFHIYGEPFAVCSRCFGVYFGLVLGFAIYPLWRELSNVEPLPRHWLFLSIVPAAVDWSLTVAGIWENTMTSRFVTGAILGLACATYILPALVEIVRNMTSRRLRNSSR
jgi:uncharacterized membrane protein